MSLTDRRVPPTNVEVAGVFLRLGAQGFGGLGAVLLLIHQELVERRGWFTEADVAEALTYTKLLPGSTVVQVVAYLGWKLRGLAGTLAATGAFLLPAFLMMLVFAAGYRYLAPLGGLGTALGGLTATVTGLLAVTTWTLGQKNITDLPGLAVAIVAAVASVQLGMHPALLVVGAGLIGVVREAIRERE